MNNTLEFGKVVREGDVRLAKDMSEVIIDKEWLEENEDAELYYMYRDLWKNGDKKKIIANDLRFDITVIPPRKMGKEFVKTKGHYHPEAAPGVTYPEIYEVMEGKAHYLLQKESEKGLDDVFLVKANAGDKVLIPPNYGHITINPSEEPLKMSNWVERNFDSIYGDILEMEGGAYYEMSNGEFVKNESYENVSELRTVESTVLPELDIVPEKEMYDIIEEPENLELLTQPQDYESVFEKVI